MVARGMCLPTVPSYYMMCTCLVQVSQDTHEVAIPKEVYTGPGTGLFDFLAAELKAFIDKHGGCSRYGINGKLHGGLSMYYLGALVHVPADQPGSGHMYLGTGSHKEG